MTDSMIRELERRFRASGSVVDEAAWLRARVQAGELSRERLELAAYFGGEAARAAVNKDVLAALEVRFLCKTNAIPKLEALRASLSDYLVSQ